MDPLRFTRELVDIESTTGSEAKLGVFLAQRLTELKYEVRRMPVEGNRFNIVALPPSAAKPGVFLSTHMDTVPPFIPSSEDETRIYGRGSCDAKGIMAAQVAASERLRKDGIAVGLLFLVGEECDSAGAQVANREAPGNKFLINGEPTENKVATASKGTLRVQLIARGRMAHSAYPELGESATEKLVEALHRLLAMPLPSHPEVGPSTMNIGLIEGGRAPNVVPDRAEASLLIRLVGPTDGLRRQILQTVGDLAEVRFGLEIPFMKFRTIAGLPTMVAAFTTDIPALANWGEPLLIGPGSIHVAHTEREHIEKKQLLDAVDIYYRIVRELIS